MSKISLEDIQQLLVLFSKKTYHASAEEDEYKTILNRAISLLLPDYNFYMIDNSTGNLSSNYPCQIPIIEGEIEVNRNTDHGQSSQGAEKPVYDNITESHYVYDLMYNARLARCHCRFPVPVIFYKGRYICRSSTLSGGPEILGRMGCQYFRFRDANNSNSPPLTSRTNRPIDEGNQYPEEDDEDDIDGDKSPFSFLPSLSTVAHEWQFFNRVRNHDIRLLKALNVDTIFDLMVENKKVKYGIYVSSSEKVDKESRYADFNIVSIPYPGCEFFKQFRHNNLNSDKLYFKWRVAYCNAYLCLPDNPPLTQLKVNWTMYQQWDLTTLTKNYIKYILNYIQETNSGILIHCISGWDRTPMFVSLIRLSLWADGLIHKSMDEMEILYFTLAYDWMLFGHHLCDRLTKEEDIFIFAFYFLKYLSCQEFSVLPQIHKKQKGADPKLPDDINQPDGDPQFDVLEKDQLGSNISLNSNSSSADSKTQETSVPTTTAEETGNTPGLLFVGGTDGSVPDASSSPKSRRTSPVNVPVEATLKNTESPTTIGGIQCTDGWQHVTSTGSLKGSDSSNSQDSNSLNNTFDDEFPELLITPQDRKERLTKVRNIFYKAYWTTIGKDIPQYKMNPLFTTIVNEFAEKVKNLTQTSSPSSSTS